MSNRKIAYTSLAIVSFVLFITIAIGPAFLNISNNETTDQVVQHSTETIEINQNFRSKVLDTNQTNQSNLSIHPQNDTITLELIHIASNTSMNILLKQDHYKPINFNNNHLQIKYVASLSEKQHIIKYKYTYEETWNKNEKFIGNNIFVVFISLAFLNICYFLAIVIQSLRLEE